MFSYTCLSRRDESRSGGGRKSKQRPVRPVHPLLESFESLEYKIKDCVIGFLTDESGTQPLILLWFRSICQNEGVTMEYITLVYGTFTKRARFPEIERFNTLMRMWKKRLLEWHRQINEALDGTFIMTIRET